MSKLLSSLVTVVLIATLATPALATSYQPTGGTQTNPAPDGIYTGSVSMSTMGTPPNDFIFYEVETPNGVLRFTWYETSSAQDAALAAATAQNDADNKVTIAGGKVTGVSTK